MPPKAKPKLKDLPKKQEQQEKVVEPPPPQSPKEEDIIKQPSDNQSEQPTDEESLRKKKQVDMFKGYVEQTGIGMAFQVIFAEILDKKIEERKVFSYSAMRLRQIGEDLQKIKMSKK